LRILDPLHAVLPDRPIPSNEAYFNPRRARVGSRAGSQRVLTPWARSYKEQCSAYIWKQWIEPGLWTEEHNDRLYNVDIRFYCDFLHTNPWNAHDLQKVYANGKTAREKFSGSWYHWHVHHTLLELSELYGFRSRMLWTDLYPILRIEISPNRS